MTMVIRAAFTVLSNMYAFNLLTSCCFEDCILFFKEVQKLLILSFRNLIIFHLMVKFQVLMQSINRITQFFSSKEAVSRDVALQTAAALQVYNTVL